MNNDVFQALDELRYVLRRYRRPVTLVVVGLVAVLFLQSTFYTVQPDEQGVVLRFGRHVALTPSGLHWKLPWPIEEAIPVPIQRVKTLEFGFSTVGSGRPSTFAPDAPEQEAVATMLTGDLNLAHVEWIVQYRIHDAALFLFRLGGARNQTEAVEDTLRDVAETVMRRLVGDVSIDDVLTTGRDHIAAEAKHEMQRQLDGYECGITVVTVNLQSVSPPETVKDAFDSVNRARQNKERVVNDALGERNARLPESRGKRDRAITEAQGYQLRVVQTAQGRAAAFLSKLTEYRRAPEVTRTRLYLETMEEVFSQVADITVIDESITGLLPLLHLGAPLAGGKISTLQSSTPAGSTAALPDLSPSAVERSGEPTPSNRPTKTRPGARP